MADFLQKLISGTLSMTVVALPILLCVPLMARRYKQKALYLVMLILTLAYLVMPFRPAFSDPLVVLPPPDVTDASVGTLPDTLQQTAANTEADALSPILTTEDDTALVQANPTLAHTNAENDGYTHPAAIPMSAILPSEKAFSLSPWQVAGSIYLAGAATLLLCQLARHHRFMRLVRRWQSKPLGGCYQVILEEEKARMGIKRPVTLRLCEAVQSPMLYGTLHPTILLPDESLDVQALRMVLRHELTHMVRMDIPFKTLSLISLAVNWFNPVCHLLNRQLNDTCETSCDEAVLRDASWTDVERYTHTILNALRRSAKGQSALSTHFSGGKKRMKNRILAMMDAHKKRIGSLLSAMVLLCSLFSGTLVAFGHAEEPEEAEKQYLVPEKRYTQTETYQQMADAIDADAEKDSYTDGMLDAPVVAYTYNPLNFAVPAGDQPTSWSMPDGQYLPGVPVQVIGKTYTVGTIKNYTEDDGMHYALVRLLNDEALTCYIPLVFLSLEKTVTPTCTITLTTDENTGFVTVYTGRSTVSQPINAYQAGSQLQLIGRQSGWYHVTVEGKTGYVKEENAVLSAEAENLFNDQLFPFDGFLDSALLGDSQAMETYYALIDQAYEEYGAEKSYWTMEQRAWYSQLTMSYGYLSEGEDVNVLPGDNDMTREQALEKAIAIIRENGDDEPNLDWYAISYAFFYNYGEDPETAHWRVSLWPIDWRTSRYAITMDRSGKCIKFYEEEAKEESQILETWGTLYNFNQFFLSHPGATEADMPADMAKLYQQEQDAIQAANDAYDSAYNDAAAKYGDNNYAWPLDVRVELFGGNNSVPQDGEMTREAAAEKAIQAIVNELGQEALDAMGQHYITGVLLQRFNEGESDEYTVWTVFVTDTPDNYINGYQVKFVDKGSDTMGEDITISTLDEVSNG